MLQLSLFRRLRLIPSGLLVGTFAPDFEYFLRLAPDHGFGTFVLTLPLALLALWLFHAFVKLPLTRLLPSEERFVGLLVVTGMAPLWWQLVAYGFFSSRDISSTIRPKR